jgi:hypothetical protein
MTAIFVAQLIAPLALVSWVWLRPAPNALGMALQVTAAVAALAALERYGLWLFPPWWVPIGAAAAVAMAAAWHLRRGRSPGQPRGWTAGRISLGFSVTLLLVSGGLLIQAGRAARTPAGPVVELSSPLGPGRYLVVNGGALQALNAHRASMDPTRTELQSWRGNGHAIDIVGIDGWGLRAPGTLPADPARYRIFGAAVLAPCTGVVIVAVDGLEDQRVPEYDREHPAGNHVLLDCGSDVHVLLAHLRRGSLGVAVRDTAAVGTFLGAVGNSGGTSEPHLHIHAQRPGPEGRPIGGDPLPMRLSGRYLVRSDRITVGRVD